MWTRFWDMNSGLVTSVIRDTLSVNLLLSYDKYIMKSVTTYYNILYVIKNN